MTNAFVRHIYISPAHTYFGRHGLPPGEEPMVEVGSVECVAGRGLEGDRFFDYKPDYKGQVTFLAWEAYAEVCRALGLAGKTPAALRRNVVTIGMDLNGLIGVEFTLQGITFAGVEECRPCQWMDTALAPGAEELLRGRGGLRARIVKGGGLRTGGNGE